MRVLICFEYFGKNYCGLQAQPNLKTVQGELESVLSGFFAQSIEIVASGRTDAGVHAMGQCAHFDCKQKNNFKIENLPLAVNNQMNDIKIVWAKEVDENFSARFDVKKKTYLYKLYLSQNECPTKQNLALRVNKNIDVGAMKEACKTLVGRHDFSAFRASGAQNKDDNVRTIFSARLIKRFDELHFEICGSGFLYNMVRIIVGTLVEIGAKKLNKNAFLTAFSSKSRKDLGQTAPPDGLYLKKVDY